MNLSSGLESGAGGDGDIKGGAGKTILDVDEQRLLFQVGLLAATEGAAQAAVTIFNGLQQVRPDRAFPSIGLAFTALAVGQGEQAIALLEDVKGRDAHERDMLEAWRGFALTLIGREAEGERVLKAVCANDNAGDGPTFARSVLETREKERTEKRHPVPGGLI